VANGVIEGHERCREDLEAMKLSWKAARRVTNDGHCCPLKSIWINSF